MSNPRMLSGETSAPQDGMAAGQKGAKDPSVKPLKVVSVG